MRRVVVVGTSGSGKSTLARDLADRLEVPWLELDAVHHLPGWTPIDEATFRERVASFVDAHDGWVVDGNYVTVRDLLWGPADTAVWLDLSRARTMWRVTSRSLRRAVTREELWNGNREEWRNLLAWDPERSVIRWAWTTHAERRRTFPVELAEPRWQPLTVHRLRTPADVRRFLAQAPGLP
jgi:adenylate kinase family enzyme